jgi:hypothetical protein
MEGALERIVVISMPDSDWMFVIGLAAGLLIGIPVAIALLWFFNQSQNTITKTYANLEEWEFIRDPVTGRTEGLKVKRTAKEAT